MATTAFSFDLNKEFDPNWEEDSAQRIFSGMTDQEKKPIDQTVVETGVKSLQPERSYTPAKEGEGRLTSDMTGNPLDDFEAPLKQEAPVVESEEPDEPSIGRIISDGYNYISQVKMVQSGRTGRNSREVAREKALDNQAIFQAYSAMQDRLSERGYDRGLVDVLGTHNGGGLRSAEDIDRLFKIKQEGITFQTEDGRTARLDPDAPWETIMEADRKTRGVKIEGGKDDIAKQITQWQAVRANTVDSSGAVLPGREGEFETANAQIDGLMQLPQGASKLSSLTSKLFRQNEEFQMAKNQGLSEYDGTPADQFDSAIAKNLNQIQSIAIKHAPSFKNNEERNAWLSNEETKNLPFKLKIQGVDRVVYATEDPNVVTTYLASGKNGPEWVNYDLSTPKAPDRVKEEQKDESEVFSPAGKLGLSARKTITQASDAIDNAVLDSIAATGINAADIGPAIYNAGASVAEAVAGAAGKPLKVERSPYWRDTAWPNYISNKEKNRQALEGVIANSPSARSKILNSK